MRQAVLSDYRYLERINEIHSLAVSRLLDGAPQTLPELAELCEDIGNLYLDVSDRILKTVMAKSDDAVP